MFVDFLSNHDVNVTEETRWIPLWPNNEAITSCLAVSWVDPVIYDEPTNQPTNQPTAEKHVCRISYPLILPCPCYKREACPIYLHVVFRRTKFFFFADSGQSVFVKAAFEPRKSQTDAIKNKTAR